MPLLFICKGLCKANPLWQRRDSPPRTGTVSCMGCAHDKPNLTSWIQVYFLMVGSSWPPCLWSTIFAHIQCGVVAFFFHPDFVSPTLPPSSLPALPCLAPSPPLASFAPCFSHLPVWPSTRRPCHHRAACSRAGESRFLCGDAAARVCREAGARVSLNVFVRDLDLLFAQQDSEMFGQVGALLCRGIIPSDEPDGGVQVGW